MSTSDHESEPISSPPSPPVVKVKRFACDRCHGQKLRCPRDSNDGPCIRCRKAGADCQYSIAKRTGRPARWPVAVERSSTGEAATKATPSKAMSFTTMVEETSGISQSDLEFLPTTSATLDFGSGGADFMWDFSQQFAQVMPVMSMDVGSEPGMTHPLPSPDLPVYDAVYGPEHSLKMERSTMMEQDFHIGMTEPQLAFTRENSPSKSKRSHGSSEDASSVHSGSLRSGSTTSLNSETRPRKRRLPTVGEGSRPNDAVWSSTSNLDYSQALSSLQCQADQYSQRLMQQTFGTSSTEDNAIAAAEPLIDVGILLSIVDSFVALLGNIAPASSSQAPSPVLESQSHWYNSASRKILPRRSQSYVISLPKDDNLELNEMDSGMLHLIFGTHTRLVFAFHVSLDAMTKQVVGGWTIPGDPGRANLSSIGSYRVPEGADLNILLHLYAISHQLDRLDATLRRYISAPGAKQSIVTFFQGRMCKEKRQQFGLESLKERALEEAAENKSLLDAKIEDILKTIRTFSL